MAQRVQNGPPRSLLMSVYILRACVAVHFVSGARPNRDWTDRNSLELNDEASAKRADCPDLKKKLQELGIRGEGNPCSWEGVECSSECQLSSLIRDGNVAGNLETITSPLFGGLKTLKLSNAKVDGPLVALKKRKRLQYLDLSGTQVSGRIGKLSSLKKLKTVKLNNTNVTGSLRELKFLTSLQVVDFSNTKVNGPLVALRNLKRLQTLELSGTEVFSDIATVGLLKDLHRVTLQKTKVKGFLRKLKPLRRLQLVDFSDAKVTGDLKDFQNLTRVTHLHLENTETSGDIADLQHLLDLKELDLFNTKVIGNLSVLVDFTGLQQLNLDNTMVEGNLDFLQKLTALRSLYLHNTNVEGDFSSLRHLTSIQKLSLSLTEAFGKLDAFQNLTELQQMKLQGTAVVGNLTSLQKLQNLQELGLSDTKVTGELGDLQHFNQLELAHLDNVKVQGDLATIKHLTHLRHLRLKKSKVYGDIAVLQNFAGLEVLGLSHSQVSGDLKALRHLTRLDNVDLRASKVTGSLTAFRDFTLLERLELRWAHINGDLSALQSVTKLQVLGMSDTDVSGDIQSLQNLTRLQLLFLSNTKVHGDVNVITKFQALQSALLQSTHVTGWLEPSTWKDCCRELKELDFADTKVGPLPVHSVATFNTAQPLLPALNSLNVSGCSLNGEIENLLVPLAGSSISTLMASGCGLRGEVPNIAAMRARVDGVETGDWRSTLSRSLQILDLSANSLASAPAVIASVRMDLRNNKMPIKVPSVLITKAVKKQTELWLVGTQLANPEDLQHLVSHELALREMYTRQKRSFSCRPLNNALLWITPELFLPQAMCACRQGYTGNGTLCSPCPANSYSSEMNSQKCQLCPHNSDAPEASSSWKDCICVIGAIQEKNGSLSCECPSGEAFIDEPGPERCESCQKLKLDCPNAGSNASTAPVQNGYARLQVRSYKVHQCLDPARCLSSGCAEGYAGRLCSDCAPGHHENLGQCKRCVEFQNISVTRVVLLALCIAAALGLFGLATWAIRRRLDFQSDLRLKCAAQLLLPQLGALLQFVQLWSLLGRLARPLEDEIDLSVSNTGNSTENSQGDAWASSMEVFQFTAQELQGVIGNCIALQCLFDAKFVRLLFAVVTPLIPLALLLACCVVEFFSFSTGIKLGLQLLTVLFIGGASGAVQLMDCQRVDGTGKMPLGDFAFRRLMPHLLCSEATWVDGVGKACAMCYGILIPSFLAFLFAKQQLVMRQTKTFVAYFESGPQKATLQLQMVSSKEHIKDDRKEQILVAAAAVYVAVHVKGRALVTLVKEKKILTVEQSESDEASTELESDFSVDFLVPQEKAAVLRNRGEIIRHNTLVQMLTEQSILAKIRVDRSDRIMLGAKQIFGKYASCQFVWMEVCLKLASAALVSVVGSKDGLGLSVTITLVVALIIGVSQPFALPQQNGLYTFSFLCLALAAVGFHQLRSWLSHVALVLPMLLLVISLARPDSREALAMRLHEELEAKLHDGPVEVSAERAQFF